MEIKKGQASKNLPFSEVITQAEADTLWDNADQPTLTVVNYVWGVPIDSNIPVNLNLVGDFSMAHSTLGNSGIRIINAVLTGGSVNFGPNINANNQSLDLAASVGSGDINIDVTFRDANGETATGDFAIMVL